MGLVLIAALGLAIDGSQLYAHRQMMQAAVDSAAQAGVMVSSTKLTLLRDGNAYGTATFTCTTTDDRTPYYFARKNGVGATVGRRRSGGVSTVAAGVSLSAVDTPNLVKGHCSAPFAAGSFDSCLLLCRRSKPRRPPPLWMWSPLRRSWFTPRHGGFAVRQWEPHDPNLRGT